jgi:hypothetical protein
MRLALAALIVAGAVLISGCGGGFKMAEQMAEPFQQARETLIWIARIEEGLVAE